MKHKEPGAEAQRAKLFGACAFVTSVAEMGQLPADGVPEVAFAGRSNVGKSSLINALTGRHNLARISHTPGRTQLLNYFSLAGMGYLVDMPGYGYAKVAKSKAAEWTQLIEAYLRGRHSLKRVILLVDARHGIKDNDKTAMSFLDRLAVSYQLVLTKIDKVKPAEQKELLERVGRELAQHAAAFPQLIVTSSAMNLGLDELRQAVMEALKS